MTDPPETLLSTPPPRKPTASPGWRWFMRISGTVAILLFLAPTVYVVKYYAFDQPREAHHARLVSTARINPTVSLSAIAPPLAPSASGNAAEFYVPAIQSYAARNSGDGLAVPTPRETALFLAGARRADCHYFATDPTRPARFVYGDPDRHQIVPYRYPLTSREKYRYLGAAANLALAMAHVPQIPGTNIDAPRQTLAQGIIRFGDSLGRERATRTHLAVATAVERIGLRLLLSHPTPALQRYVDSLQVFDEAVQSKYALLEPNTADNLALQQRVAHSDADSMWRREAIWAMAETLHDPWLAFSRPLETLTAKATLSDVAVHDTDPSVRAAAAAALGEIAQRGAVLRR